MSFKVGDLVLWDTSWGETTPWGENKTAAQLGLVIARACSPTSPMVVVYWNEEYPMEIEYEYDLERL